MAESLGARIKALPFEVRQYMLITGNYWAFTLTDGALRMLVVLHFHELGYSPLDIALLGCSPRMVAGENPAASRIQRRTPLVNPASCLRDSGSPF